MFISVHIGWNLWVDMMDGTLCHAGRQLEVTDFGVISAVAGAWDEWSDEWSEFLIHSHAPCTPCKVALRLMNLMKLANPKPGNMSRSTGLKHWAVEAVCAAKASSCQTAAN